MAMIQNLMKRKMSYNQLYGLQTDISMRMNTWQKAMVMNIFLSTMIIHKMKYLYIFYVVSLSVSFHVCLYSCIAFTHLRHSSFFYILLCVCLPLLKNSKFVFQYCSFHFEKLIVCSVFALLHNKLRSYCSKILCLISLSLI